MLNLQQICLFIFKTQRSGAIPKHQGLWPRMPRSKAHKLTLCIFLLYSYRHFLFCLSYLLVYIVCIRYSYFWAKLATRSQSQLSTMKMQGKQHRSCTEVWGGGIIFLFFFFLKRLLDHITRLLRLKKKQQQFI